MDYTHSFINVIIIIIIIKFVECIFYTNIQMCFSSTKRKKAIKSSKIKVTTTVAKNFSNF